MSKNSKTSFLTVAQPASFEFTERKSRFISYIRNTETRKEFEAFLEQKKMQHPEATHHVWAWRILENGRVRELFSDDGEPAKSAGAPTLKPLAGNELENVSVVTVRYYGGTKLGVGGLIRAYSKGSKMAIKNSEIIRMVPAKILENIFEYSLIGQVEKFLESKKGKIVDREFSDDVLFKIEIAEKYFQDFKIFMKNLTRGNEKIKIKGEKYVIWS